MFGMKHAAAMALSIFTSSLSLAGGAGGFGPSCDKGYLSVGPSQVIAPIAETSVPVVNETDFALLVEPTMNGCGNFRLKMILLDENLEPVQQTANTPQALRILPWAMLSLKTTIIASTAQDAPVQSHFVNLVNDLADLGQVSLGEEMVNLEIRIEGFAPVQINLVH